MQTGEFKKSWDAKESIKNQEVSINDKIIVNPNYQFKLNKDIVKHNGKQLKIAKKLYYIMNKPAGYICQKSSKQLSVYDLFEKINIPETERNSLFIVGRLDKNTTGLIIITNDGNYSNRLMQPDKEKEKTYEVIIEKSITSEEIRALERGVEIFIDDKPYITKPCKIKPIDDRKLKITLSEGKKNQIKKMLKTINNKVIGLNRESIGNIKLNNLKSGEIAILEKDL